MTKVAQWLESLGLAKYENAFTANEITFDQLADLTDEDLREVGLPVGPRRAALTAILALKANNVNAGNTGQTTAGATVVAHSGPANDSAERRQVTVLFCDLVGSTALATQLDPEDYRNAMRTYHACCAAIVAKFDGSVAQYLGDGVMARFGYPTAHEDDAVRAVRCGLEIITAIGNLRSPSDQSLNARIGIATGVVVVGDVANSARAD